MPLVYLTQSPNGQFNVGVDFETGSNPTPLSALWTSPAMPGPEAIHVAYKIKALGRYEKQDLISGKLKLYKTVTPGLWSFALTEVLDFIAAGNQ